MITLYSTGCPNCRMLKMRLDKYHVEYTVCENVDEMRSKGISTVPALDVDGHLMNFSESIQYLKEHYEEEA